MSTQSIIHNTDDKIAIQITNFLKEAGTRHLLKKRFDVGCGVCMNDIRKINRLVRIFCQENCMLTTEEMQKVKERINRILIFNTPKL